MALEVSLEATTSASVPLEAVMSRLDPAFGPEIHAVLIAAHQQLVVRAWAELSLALRKDEVQAMLGVCYELKPEMKEALHGEGVMEASVHKMGYVEEEGVRTEGIAGTLVEQVVLYFAFVAALVMGAVVLPLIVVTRSPYYDVVVVALVVVLIEKQVLVAVASVVAFAAALPYWAVFATMCTAVLEVWPQLKEGSNEMLSVANLAIRPLLVASDSKPVSVENPVVMQTKHVLADGHEIQPLEAVPYGTVVSLALIAVFDTRAVV